MALKKKVLIAITQSNFGGAQRYVYDLASSISKNEFDVTVLAGGDGLLVKRLREAGIRTIQLNSLRRNMSFISDARAFCGLLRILFREKPDVLHLNSSKMGGIGVVAGRIARVRRIIFTTHGWEFNAPRPYWQKIIIRVLSRFIVRLSHITIAVSDATKKQLGGTSEKKITVIHNGVGVFHLKSRMEARADLAKRAGINYSDDEFWIGTLAELHPVKGLVYGIDAAVKVSNAIDNAQYFVLGEGKEREVLERRVKDSQMEKHIHLVGFVEDAREHLNAFDIFLLPSRSESFSLVVLEAGLASLPVIASNVGGIPELITSPASGMLVPAGDTRAIADAAIFLAKNKASRELMGQTLHARVMREFSLEKMVNRTTALYKS